MKTVTITALSAYVVSNVGHFSNIRFVGHGPHTKKCCPIKSVMTLRDSLLDKSVFTFSMKQRTWSQLHLQTRLYRSPVIRPDYYR